MKKYVLCDNKYFVSTNWLEQRLNDSSVRIIDASWYLPNVDRSGLKEFESKHIPGASFFDLDNFSDANSDLPHMALNEKDFSNKFEIFGIKQNQNIIVYDGLGLFSAPRLLWLLHLYGFHNVFILDGGFPKWISENKPTNKEVLNFKPCKLNFSYDKNLVVSMEFVMKYLNSQDIQIIDARSSSRFLGIEKEPRKGLRSGHIPNSINLYYGDVLNSDYTLKSNDILKNKIDELGIDLTKHLITSCGSGVTASILYVIFKGLGAKRVSVYDGSWCEWGKFN